MFYVVTVQMVILFGSETWKLSPLAMKCLDGFHLKAARRMTGMVLTRGADGTWFYPLLKDILEAASLHTITAYIHVPCDTSNHCILHCEPAHL